ncbi:N,N-dimethylformamidase beta subunit family domain-containing protein [Reyranella sp. CPCC 100927]|uniref:N,N-dimethylformamidase beta subunit family domain-containing protein n=1 Tax=Reyranella sp. CPCC 100927 TaxID=2599616 RepID=UPI002102F300|nr:N,N-dimethylformamidase beta subunit family domain-containing protein [Reyranella sp. CPCC 100927]
MSTDSRRASMPEYTPMNVVKRHSVAMHPGDNWHLAHWYEAPREDPAVPEVYTYTDAISYAPGSEVAFHSSTTAVQWTIQVWRDGVTPTLVHEATDLPGRFVAAPADAYRDGCKWPVSHRWQLPLDLPSGFYRVASTCAAGTGASFLHHHFFVVTPADPAPPRDRFLFILPTSTWLAYNDWGGANSYDGIDGANRNQFSPTLSTERPWTRGLVWLPPGAPRLCDPQHRRAWEAPRYPTKEWAFTNGFAQYFASAGWAQFDRHFAVWAEREGYAFDMITQTDLHYRPEILARYGTAVIVGHDEYWTADMRRTVDAFVDGGGKLARFAGNYLWQVRLEDEGRRQVCYKARAHDEDPVRGTDRAHLLTGAWEDPAIGWPGATTVGVNGLQGVYASWGGLVPRSSRGFTVYRPGHWAFAGTEISYGDVIGGEAGVFGYEVDGLDYTFRRGLPYPTGDDGAPGTIEILAMAPAVRVEEEHRGEGFRYYLGNGRPNSSTKLVPPGTPAGDKDPQHYGSGMIVAMPRGRGEVFTAGSCEWVMGLARGDFCTQQITRNVLDRFLGRRA